MADFGLSKDLAAKQKSKYDLSAEKEVVEWVNKMVMLKKGQQQVVGGGADQLKASLENGDVLCSLINKIKPGSISDKICKQKLKEGGGTNFTAFEKIANKQRITAAVEAFKKLGVSESSTFRAEDLTEGKNMTAVLLCVYMVGRICNQKKIGKGGIKASGAAKDNLY